MQTTQRQALSLKKLKDIQPKVLQLPRQEMVTVRRLVPDRTLPLLIQPAVADLDLAEWAHGNLDLIAERLLESGALLFRGFAIAGAEEFERFARQLCPVLYDDNGEHQRESAGGSVYTPVFFPPDQQLLWHNENSFNHRWPMKIMFCCAEPPERGGETPIVDSRQVYQRLDPEVRRAFETRQVTYTRCYGDGLGLDWSKVFQTTDPAVVERRAREERFTAEWRPGGKLRTRAVRPAVVRHPLSGEPSWFNQAQHWHLSCLDPQTRHWIESVFGEDDLPRSCHFGDGGKIEDSMMASILEVYRSLEVSFPWQRGDVMVLDNVLAAHGRNPFAGKRKLLVAMGEMTSFEEV